MGLRIVKKNPDSLPVALLYGYVCKKSLCDRLKLRSDECEAHGAVSGQRVYLVNSSKIQVEVNSFES